MCHPLDILDELLCPASSYQSIKRICPFVVYQQSCLYAPNKISSRRALLELSTSSVHSLHSVYHLQIILLLFLDLLGLILILVLNNLGTKSPRLTIYQEEIYLSVLVYQKCTQLEHTSLLQKVIRIDNLHLPFLFQIYIFVQD